MLAADVSPRHTRRYGLQIKCSDLVAEFARRCRFVSLEYLAVRKGREYFQASLDWKVEKGELAVVSVPTQAGLDTRSFSSELAKYAGSNELEVVFMRFETSADGLTSGEVYVRASDEDAIRDYVEP